MTEKVNLPNREQIVDAISRLRKDAAILSNVKGKADVDPVSLTVVADFLQALVPDEEAK